MRIAVLGTGIVGRVLAEGLAGLGHDVVIGTRDPKETLARREGDAMGNPPFAQWHEQHGDVGLVSFPDAGEHAELVVNATAGQGSLAALRAVGADSLAGKVVIDVANPLDFSQGMPPTMSVANTDSLAEQIQREFPDAKVVKALNTMNAHVMVDPSRVPGDHDVFLAGDDAEAKATVRTMLGAFGWREHNIVDAGGIRAARGLEMYVVLWVTLFQSLGTGDFNVKIVKS